MIHANLKAQLTITLIAGIETQDDETVSDRWLILGGEIALEHELTPKGKGTVFSPIAYYTNCSYPITTIAPPKILSHLYRESNVLERIQCINVLASTYGTNIETTLIWSLILTLKYIRHMLYHKVGHMHTKDVFQAKICLRCELEILESVCLWDSREWKTALKSQAMSQLWPDFKLWVV